MEAWEAGDHGFVRAILAESVRRLERAGAAFFVCPDNTAHIALELPGEDLALPGLHIADVVSARAHRDGRRTVGILGTKYLMASDVYPSSLAAVGIASQLPEPDERAMIDRVIFGELVAGVFTDDARRAYVEVIGHLAQRGCDAVALVCTEIPLLVSENVSPLPTLDSTRLLAAAALDVCLGGTPFPSWRGGPRS